MALTSAVVCLHLVTHCSKFSILGYSIFWGHQIEKFDWGDDDDPLSWYENSNLIMVWLQGPDFEAKVAKLVELGFGRDAVIQALKFFDGNEEQAAGYLFGG